MNIAASRAAVCILVLFAFTGAAFAASPAVAPTQTFMSGGPLTTNNDAACDIGLFPAATLLLPYFEVDILAPSGSGETTLFTVTNTSNLPQIAHVTLWTDWSYPVIAFNLYLTGYDVQSINLYDVIVGGRIAPEAGTGPDVSPVGRLSGNPVADIDHDNALVDEASCSDLPVNLTQTYVARMQQAFTLGRIPAAFGESACNTAGDVHANAVGYVTVNVVSHCTILHPADDGYFSSVILFDNVLMGDFQQVNGAQNFAQGNPMVHIRAVPEGGSIAQRASGDENYQVNFKRTFYSRYQPAATKTFDARQPLPTTFAGRWISGGATGYQTFYKIWREGRTGSNAPCSAYRDNGGMGITEIVRFDEDENPHVWPPPEPICTPIPFYPTIPPSVLLDIDDTNVFPPRQGHEVAGWMYMNFDRCNQDDFATQGWVTVSMRAEGRYSTDFDALAFGNGCTPPLPQSQANIPGGPVIGPAANVNP
jgi:hypothetical protein